MRLSIAITSALFVLAVTTGTAAADDHVVKAGPTITADGSLVIPVGDLSDGAGLGIGVSGTFNFPLNEQLSATGRAGLIYHLPKDVAGTDINLLVVPLLGGARYALQPSTNSIYGFGEAGLFYARVSAGDFDDSETNLGLVIGAGYKMGKIDVRAGLQTYDIGEFGDAMSLIVVGSYGVAAL